MEPLGVRVKETRFVTNPDWLTQGWPHIWLPYAQMKTAPAPLAVVGAEGSRLKLADGRELIDGVASWWTVAHGTIIPISRPWLSGSSRRCRM
jgi:glutamate-1-semialdehyde aminotransferase